MVFLSGSSDLLLQQTSGQNAYVYDFSTNTVTLVSQSDSGALPDDGMVFAGVLSGDGSTVAFLSQATNLVANDTNAANDVYLKAVE